MSSAADRERIEAKIEAAKAVLAEICMRVWAGEPALKWSVPAQETDDDLVIADALSQLSALSEALSAANDEIATLKAERKAYWDSLPTLQPTRLDLGL